MDRNDKDSGGAEETLIEYISNQATGKEAKGSKDDDKHKDALISLLEQQFQWEQTKGR